MHSYRNLNTFFTQSAVSYGKEYYKVFAISHFCATFAWNKRREKKLNGGTKAIN